MSDQTYPAQTLTDVVIRDVLQQETSCVRRSLEVLGEILAGSTAKADTDETFAAAALGVAPSEFAVETMKLSATTALSVGIALGELISRHDPTIGPGDDSDPPEWRRVELDGTTLSMPKTMSLCFAAGTIGCARVVVKVIGADCYRGPALFVLAPRADREVARTVIDVVVALAKERNVMRGRALHATVNDGLQLEFAELAVRARSSISVPEHVWREIDVNIAALTTRADLMRQLGLGTRRGILLAGPPGVGKSAISTIVAGELVGDFTVVIVDARAAQYVLRDVFEEIKELGPTVVILEDIDLYIGDRRTGSGGMSLADFLAVMDGSERYDDVLTIASTNDPEALDKAATRASRFDAIVALDYPDLTARVEILRGLLSSLACVGGLDLFAVAARIGGAVSGADLREIVRRAVLAYGTDLTTERLHDVVDSGRWKPEPLVGAYL